MNMKRRLRSMLRRLDGRLRIIVNGMMDDMQPAPEADRRLQL